MIEIVGIQFPVIYIHLGALALTLPALILADKAGLSWFKGKKEILSAGYVRTLHAIVTVGLTAIILSGAYMAWPLRDYLVQSTAFWIKMFFVAVLVVNSFFIGNLMKTASEVTFSALSEKQRKKFIVSGSVSIIGWVGAFTAALFMTTSNWIISLFSRFVGLF